MKEKIIKLLSTDKITYLSHLKMIGHYGEQTIYKLLENRNDWALSMLIPTELSSFDIASYPQAKYIVYVAGSNENLIRDIIIELPSDCHLVFKISRVKDKDLIMERFNLTFKKAYLSYSTDKLIKTDCLNVISASVIDESLIPLWLENGYDKCIIEKYFNNGAVSFSVYSNNAPLSTCIIFSSFDDIWEIGAVHTIPDERGKGYGKLVVSAAINYIVCAKKQPNYQVEHTNIPSIKLAESLGLRKAVIIEHFYY